jgi:hypothetical protein
VFFIGEMTMNSGVNELVNPRRIIKVYISKTPDSFSGELGQSATRRINIVGTANVGSTGLEGVSGIGAALRQAFENQGWFFSNFEFSGGGLFSDTVSINLTADVPNQYSNQDHLDQAYRILNNYQLSSGVTSWRPLGRVNLTLTGADNPNYKPIQTTSISGTRTPVKNNSNSNNLLGLPSFGSLDTSLLLVVAVVVGIKIWNR